MTLAEISAAYGESAALVRRRIGQLRDWIRKETDPETVRNLERRIQVLTPIWREMREMEAWTGGYYRTGPREKGARQ